MASSSRFITITIGGKDYRLPLQGTEPSWAEQVSSILKALAEVSELVQGPNDILLSSANILNNQSTPVNFSNVAFDTTEVLSFEMEYFITRSYDPGTGVTVESQSGLFRANFDGSNWKTTQEDEGRSDVVFNITPGGVLQYSSSDLSTYISGLCRYKVKTIDDEV